MGGWKPPAIAGRRPALRRATAPAASLWNFPDQLRTKLCLVRDKVSYLVASLSVLPRANAPKLKRIVLAGNPGNLPALMQQVNLGIVGGGTVGGGVFQAIQRNGALISSRLGVRLHVA